MACYVIQRRGHQEFLAIDDEKSYWTDAVLSAAQFKTRLTAQLAGIENAPDDWHVKEVKAWLT